MNTPTPRASTRRGLLLLLVPLALAACSACAPHAARPVGPAPAAILLVPTVGEDFVQPLLFLGPVWRRVDPRQFVPDLWKFGPDFEISRPDLMTFDGDSVGLAHVADVLDRAAKADVAKCDSMPGMPRWPDRWTVRVFGRAAILGPHVGREFTVSRRAVRCEARAALSAFGMSRDVPWRTNLQVLAKLGVMDSYPPPPRPRLAPAEQREALLAMMQAEDDGPALGLLDVSVWFWPANRRTGMRAARYADFADREFPKRQLDADVVSLPRGALRALLAEALGDSAVQRGAERARGSLPMSVSHGEFRVLDRTWDIGGPHYSQPIYMAYLTRDETVRLAERLARVLKAGPPGAASDLAVGSALLRAGSGN